ncbi:MAG: glycosyltransferase family 39 protein [Acidobacteriia bacterium]|nr:glycosyltransferase family 39 protein [Terriglobia bacterium]
MNRNRFVIALCIVLTLIAVGRILLTYTVTSQGFDEPCHVAVGIALLDQGTYTIDPVHPPLARLAIGLPAYLAGERYPRTGEAATSNNCNAVGNSILYDSGHYRRNLTLARLGMLPFFLYAVAIVFLWTRREFGDFAAVIAVALFTTLPVVLAFSSIAYTDMTAASTQAAGLCAFAMWLEKRTARSSALLGIAVGLALSAKFTTLIFLPAGAAAISVTKWLVTRKAGVAQEPRPAQLVRQIAIVGLLASTMLWGSYRFDIGHIRESMQLSVASMPSFQNFPAPLRGVARKLVLSDPVIPAPALVRGLAVAWGLNHSAPESYLLGRIKHGGWWYFFLVGIAVKSPLPFLILALVGVFALWPLARNRQWTAVAPAASALAILLVSTPVKVDVGVRHVLVIFPLLAILAGYGCSYLWQLRVKWAAAPKVVLLGLLVWQGVSTFRARQDYIAYFNELAGRDPSRILLMGCDLDCGQDLFRLSDALRARHISQLNLAVWSGADMSRMALPDFAVPLPYTPVHGWFAISMRSLRLGHVLHTAYPPDAYAWLSQYQPVEKIGKTIWLYYIP